MANAWVSLKTTYSVADFIGWQESGALNLNPDFQRNSVWKHGAKSYFIDTIIRGFPTPLIFLRELTADLKTFKAKRDVVDGQQRLRTVIAFARPELLEDFDSRDDFTIRKEHNEDFQGRKFSDLPNSVKRQILDYQFSVNVFPSATDDREVRQVFSRMNSSGYRLNAQELRNAEFFGAFKVLAETLATEQYNRWKEWKVLSSDDIARMKDIEMVSEFIILAINGVSEKKEQVITAFYEKFEDSFPASRVVSGRIRRVFDALEDHLANDIPELFKKRTLFYALFAAIYALQYGLKSPLKGITPKVISTREIQKLRAAGERIQSSDIPLQIAKATRGGTTHVRERQDVINYLLTGK